MADPVKVNQQKRPYQKPAFMREEVFETMALACGKLSTSNTNACRAEPNVS